MFHWIADWLASQNLGTNEFPFTAQNFIQSSYSTFVAGGFNYTVLPADNVQQVLKIAFDDILNGSLWDMVGTFNLPVCDPSGTWTLDQFYSNMNYTAYGEFAR